MENLVEFKNVSKYFKDFSLENMNLQVKQGQITGFVGANGAGKSTTMKLMMNLLQPDTGEIKVFGKLICEYNSEGEVDQFGHKQLSGCAAYLETVVREKIEGAKVRSIELSLPQRCTPWLTSKTDTDEAEKAGRTAVNAVMEGKTGLMVAFIRDGGKDYKIDYKLIPVGEVCNKEKPFPMEWIVNGNDISDKFLDYVTPLIQGENKIEYENGLPKLLKPAYIK